MRVAKLTILGLFLPSLAYGQITTGDLQEYCINLPKENALAVACMAYIGGFRTGYELGLADAVTSLGKKIIAGVRSICFPDQAKNQQVAAVFLQWANANPKFWHEPASQGLLRALSTAFPCR